MCGVFSESIFLNEDPLHYGIKFQAGEDKAPSPTRQALTTLNV
jgi:hypothetical protein